MKSQGWPERLRGVLWVAWGTWLLLFTWEWAHPLAYIPVGPSYRRWRWAVEGPVWGVYHLSSLLFPVLLILLTAAKRGTVTRSLNRLFSLTFATLAVFAFLLLAEDAVPMTQEEYQWYALDTLPTQGIVLARGAITLGLLCGAALAFRASSRWTRWAVPVLGVWGIVLTLTWPTFDGPYASCAVGMPRYEVPWGRAADLGGWRESLWTAARGVLLSPLPVVVLAFVHLLRMPQPHSVAASAKSR